jgi:gluconokinase
MLVGVDIGTSSVKVLATTDDGRQIASDSESYDLITPQAGYVEQDANVVYLTTMRVLTRVLADVRLCGSEIDAIGISCAMHGVIAVDTNGEPLSHMITWMDRRSAAVADRWRSDGTGLALYQRTGSPMHPMLPVAKLRWLREHDPSTFEKAARFVGMKELIVYRWTGEWLVDWGLASGTGLFDVHTRAWDSTALELGGIDAERLSRPVAPSTTLRQFRPTVAASLGLNTQTAVVLASSDGALANLGVGATRADREALTLGTSGAVRIVTDEPVLDAQGRTFCYAFDDTRYLIGGPTSSGGAVLTWVFNLVLPDVPQGERFSTALHDAAEIEPGAEGLVVLPFLSGERAPLWMSELRGSIEGLDLAHDRRHIIRAAFESVIFGLYSVHEVVRERLGAPQQILLSGGVTKAPLVRMLVANIFGLPASLPNEGEASAFGAAMMAAHAIGAIPSLDIVRTLLHEETRDEPDAGLVARYAELYARYRSRVSAIVPLYA